VNAYLTIVPNAGELVATATIVTETLIIKNLKLIVRASDGRRMLEFPKTANTVRCVACLRRIRRDYPMCPWCGKPRRPDAKGKYDAVHPRNSGVRDAMTALVFAKYDALTGGWPCELIPASDRSCSDSPQPA
jgi:LSD1 subclass zinc finger protein